MHKCDRIPEFEITSGGYSYLKYDYTKVVNRSLIIYVHDHDDLRIRKPSKIFALINIVHILFGLIQF